MPDFDATVALNARGYDPQDAVAPLQAYMLSAEGRDLDARAQGQNISNQLAGLSLASKQSYAKTLATPGADQLGALNSSGLPAFDPEAAKASYGNIQSSNVLGAIKNYDPNNPSSLAKGGPDLVGQGATVQSSLASAAQTNQATARQRQDQIGELALGFLHSDRSESARQTTLAMAHDSSLFHDPVTGQFNHLMYHSFQTMPLSQFTERAKQLAASGTQSVVNSGTAAGDIARETTINTPIVTSPGQSVWTSDQLRNAMTGGQTPTSRGAPPSAATYGRSVATDGAPVPVAPAPGNGSRPIAGGFLGNGGAPAGSSGIGSSPPASAQPPLMAQAEKAFGLPTSYLSRTAQIESGGRANASNPSGASGLFQFVPSTWARYGDPGTSPLNPQAATVAAARLAADNSASLTKALGRQPTAAELYLAHQQGAAGAVGLLANPNVPAASIVGAKAVISNGGTSSMTAGAFAQMWERRFNGAGNSGNFTLSGPSQMGTGVSMPAASALTLPGAGGVGLRAAAGVDASPPQPTRPDLAPPVAGPIPLPSSTQPMPTAPPSATMGRSASDGGLPQTRQLSNGGALQPLVKGMAPFEYAKQGLDAARAVDEEKTARDQFIAAGDAQRGLMQLQEDLTKLTPGPNDNLRDTLLAPGSGADRRIGLAKAVNSALATVGAQPLFDPEKITAAESAAKTSGRLGFDLAGGLGKGQAGFIVNEAIGLNPSVLNTPQGGKLLIGSLLASQQRQKDLYLFQGEFARENGGNPIGAEVEFDQSHPPMRYVQDARNLARVPQPAVKYLQAHPDQGTISAFNRTYGPSLARYWLGSRTD